MISCVNSNNPPVNIAPSMRVINLLLHGTVMSFCNQVGAFSCLPSSFFYTHRCLHVSSRDNCRGLVPFFVSKTSMIQAILLCVFSASRV